MTKQKFSKKQAIQVGWNTMKSNFWFFVGVLVFVFAVSYIPGIMFGAMKEKELPTIITILSFIVALIFWIIQIIVSMGLINIAIKFIKLEKTVFRDLFIKTNKIIDFILSSIVYSLIVTVGLILLIVPGIIFIVRFQFYQYLIIEKDKGPIEALKISWRITEGSVWNLILFWGLIMIINIAGATVFGIGLLATIPTTMIAMAWVYKKLLSTENV